MRRIQIKIISGSIKIYREQKNCVEIVLLAICLRLHKQHLLGEPVRSVRFFRIPVPEVFLFEWNRCELRIRANRADRYELLNTIPASVLHQLDTHHEIVVKKTAGIRSIGANTPDVSGNMDDYVRLCVFIHSLDVPGFDKVVIPLAGDEDTAG